MLRYLRRFCVIFTQLAPQREAMKRIPNLIDPSIYCGIVLAGKFELMQVGG